MQSKTFPNKIWFLWFQGKANMPEIVQMCFESWQCHNPNWEIVFLDDGNLNEYINFTSELNLNRDEIPLQAQSDIIRINLLKKFGGVWADSTCYCTKPLDSWLLTNMSSGFFAFNRPNKDRMISSWFLASERHNYLAEAYCKATNVFWQNNPPHTVINSNEKLSSIQSVLLRLFASKPALWHSKFVKNHLSFSHYFWFHYLFEHLYNKDSAFKKIGDMTSKISANIPHQLMHFGFSKPASAEILAEINNPKAPLYKLDWRIPWKQESATTLGALIAKDRINKAK